MAGVEEKAGDGDNDILRVQIQELQNNKTLEESTKLIDQFHQTIIKHVDQTRDAVFQSRLLYMWLWWNWHGTSLCHGVYLYSVLAYEEASAKLRTRMAEKDRQ
ncbi:hypothetical protein AVEN_177722-1 [Araneus ventricosus]|uniref:Uncharacterized protein n=1 Tax=Araneus ventricosus TaxID=182803 RepID=A0A4Y2WEX7_ARAVE|nr:hypothetical protein AVEN_177722-1 [Araneus ventricosus]